MKQMYYVITTLFMGILLCACEKEEVDTFPSDLTRSEWCTEPLVSGEMYVYEFSSMTIGTPNGSGKKHRCYGNGRVLETQTFNWTYASNLSRLTLQFDNINKTETYTVTRYDDTNIWLSNGSNWTAYTMQSDYDLWQGNPIPADLFAHPKWYDFEKISKWEWQNNRWTAQDVAYIHKERKLLAIKGESVIRKCEYQKNVTFDTGGYSWRLSEGCLFNSNGKTYILSTDRPLIDLKDEQRVPDFVLAEPEAYGFQYKKCWAQHCHLSLNYYLRPDDSAIYYNDKGAFLVPGSTNINCNIYNLWYYDNNWAYSEEGVWRFTKGSKYFVYGSTSAGTEYQTYVTFDTPTLERVFTPEETYNINSRGSSYVQAAGLSYTGSYVFYVYDPEFTISKVSVTYSGSWLWTAKLEALPPESEYYTKVRLLWANSANSGAARTGYIYITVSNVKGETYYHTLTVNQQGTSGSGGGGGTGGGSNEEANLGPDWVKGKAPGYLPYYYCPDTGETTPANPRSADITIYRNKNTGAYKAAYAGKLYNAKYGYNKITMETEAHSVYDSVYKYWKTCIDKLILEFTIY